MVFEVVFSTPTLSIGDPTARPLKNRQQVIEKRCNILRPFDRPMSTEKQERMTELRCSEEETVTRALFSSGINSTCKLSTLGFKAQPEQVQALLKQGQSRDFKSML